MINADVHRKDEEGRAAGELRARRTGGRGAIWPRRLKRGRWPAAALDVFVEEPLKNSPLTALDNVILTPHVGGSTHEAQEAVGVQIARQVKEYLKHGVIQNAVNVPSVSAEEYARMQPYIVLAERMGAFLAQVARDRWRRFPSATAATSPSGRQN